MFQAGDAAWEKARGRNKRGQETSLTGMEGSHQSRGWKGLSAGGQILTKVCAFARRATVILEQGPTG